LIRGFTKPLSRVNIAFFYAKTSGAANPHHKLGISVSLIGEFQKNRRCFFVLFFIKKLSSFLEFFFHLLFCHFNSPLPFLIDPGEHSWLLHR